MKKITLLFISLFVVILCVGCSYKNGGLALNNYYYYEDEDTYNIGEQTYEETIKKIDISYISGDVELKYTDSKSIKISETLSSNDEDDFLRSKIENNKLIIKYFKSGSRMSITKKLTIEVPSGTYNEIKGDFVSANFTSKVSSLEYDLDTVSGKTNIYNINSNKVDIDTISGEVYLEVKEGLKELEVDGLSSKVSIILKNNIEFAYTYGTTSGDLKSNIDLSNKKNVTAINEFEVETVSGDLIINLEV